jgi:rhodanese-related sulfurtransferase
MAGKEGVLFSWLKKRLGYALFKGIGIATFGEREVKHMKKLIGVLLLALVVVFAYTATPALAEDDNEGLGDYVHSSLGSGPRLDIAPGIYAHIAERADAFLAGSAKTIFAADVKKKMDAGESLYIMDIRANKDYVAGHIPGAQNIEFANAAKPESLALLPTDGTQIVVVCYTSQTGNQVTSILNLLGYDAWALRFGMMGWRTETKMKIGSSASSAQSIKGMGYSEAVGQ